MTQPTRDSLTEALFAPLSVRAYAAPVAASLISSLRREELPAAVRMVPKRQAEFATARACARAALADLGIDAAIPKREGGSPVWPSGTAGSISHTRGYCVAVAAAGAHLIGVDVEEVGRISAGVERRILIDAERGRLEGLDDPIRQQQVATIFAAKEAFYKAHYEFDARYIGFDVISVAVSEDGLAFEAASGAVRSEIVDRVAGRFCVANGRVTVGVSIDTTGLAMPLRSGP